MTYKKILTGIDIVYIPRFKSVVEKHGPPSTENPFLKRVFNPEEISRILERTDPYPGLAGRFAAKEAVIKALSGVMKISDLKSVRILGEVPLVKLELDNVEISVSISHDKDYSVASCSALM